MVEFTIVFRHPKRKFLHPDGTLINGMNLLKRAQRKAGMVPGSMKNAPLEEAAKQAQKDAVIMQKFLDEWVLV